MREAIYDWKNGILTLHVKLWFEFPLGEKVPIDISKTEAFNLIEQVRTTGHTTHSWKRIGYQRGRGTFDYFHCLCRIDSYWYISRPMCRLTIIAMAVELRDRLANNSQCHCPTTTRRFFNTQMVPNGTELRGTPVRSGTL